MQIYTICSWIKQVDATILAAILSVQGPNGRPATLKIQDGGVFAVWARHGNAFRFSDGSWCSFRITSVNTLLLI